MNWPPLAAKLAPFLTATDTYSKLEEIVNEMLAASGSDLTESKEE